VPTFAVSPDHAFASSPQITVTITGSQFGGPHRRSTAIWQVGNDTTPLATTFVIDTLLTAVIPAELLQNAGSASIFIETGDVQADVPPPRSRSLTFTVLPRSLDFSITPASATAASADVTITVHGSGFRDNGQHDRSWAVWSVNGTDTWLSATVVDSKTLTAAVPAALLATPVVAVVSVWTGDPRGDAPSQASGAADFTVTP
jgi:hypothetical protein